MTKMRSVDEALKEGDFDQRDGKDMQDNRYEKGTSQHYAWLSGWSLAAALQSVQYELIT